MELLKDILPLTDPKLDLNSITVLGIGLNDSSESIPPELITEDPRGGWLNTSKGVAFRISENEPKVIVEFILKPELLKELKLTKKSRIEQRFGEASAIEHKLGSTYYFYENQKMVISWNNSNDQLFGIYLGENVIKQTQFRVKDFLDKYYEFKAMTPNYNEWNAKSLKYNKPRFYRFKELESLMVAFDIGNDLLTDFKNRKFLNHRTLEDFRPIVEDIERYVSQNGFEKLRWERERERLKDIRSFGMLVQIFMRFSEEMRNLLNFNSGWLESGSVTSRYSIHKTHQLLKSIDLQELHEIEHLLCKLIDPKERTFTKSELIKNYEFPDVDLHSIDMDNY
ncbi:hypothetical protein KFE98_02590 [bacterium SCSIO 12741]|nr:hypothetical protein KFE98_02590 [bacterium SCSIO 12741]